MNKLNIVENYLCDLLDYTYNDGILCDKEFVPSIIDCRAIYVSNIANGNTDQSISNKYNVVFKSIRKERTEASNDIDIFSNIFPIYNKNIENKLVLSANMSYIIPPSKIMVDSKVVYIISANLDIIII